MVLRTANPLSYFPLHFTVKPLFSRTLRTFSPRFTYSITAASVSETAFKSTFTAAQEILCHHPWPEWIAFVDHLKSKGYFLQNSSSTSSGGNTALEYREMNLLKDPCLSFARDRYDIFRSLPKGEIQNIVKDGCPKLLRKVVNSAKRLRLYVGLDEKIVCDTCSLRGSCDRAYIMLQKSEGDAGTVDLLRLLLFYALDPLVLSGTVRPAGIGHAEASARRLLTMFIDLSEASPGLTHVESCRTASHETKGVIKSMDGVLSQTTELQQEKRRYPKAEGFKQSSARGVEMKRGDWNCPQCGCMNFASRRDCFRCKGPRPPRTLNPGEWECPKCDFLNFRKNVMCFKCGINRSEEAVVQYEEHL